MLVMLQPLFSNSIIVPLECSYYIEGVAFSQVDMVLPVKYIFWLGLNLGSTLVISLLALVSSHFCNDQQNINIRFTTIL